MNATPIAYVNIFMADFPEPSRVETHAIRDTGNDTERRKAVRKILGQWMEKGDVMAECDSACLKGGRVLTPYVIRTPGGEGSDIFAQLIVGSD